VLHAARFVKIDRSTELQERQSSEHSPGRKAAGQLQPVSARARSIADQFLNAPTIIAAVDGNGMTRLTGIVSTTRDLGL